MLKIKIVTILGANGNIGSLCGGLIAAFGDAKIFMVSRTIEKANEGIAKAINSVKSDSIRDNLIPLTYDDLFKCIPKSDWVIEAVFEDMNVKHSINREISKYLKLGTIISSTSSGLSINKLAYDFKKEIQRYYFGTHFFNPPYKMLLCEIIPNLNSDQNIQLSLCQYLEKILLRKVVVSGDTPAFIGNRIGFEILSEALVYSQKYGVSYIDYILGGISGRIMPPLGTIDLVGLDIYRAITKNLKIKNPTWVDKLIAENKLGNKSGGGLYKISEGRKFELNIKENKYVAVEYRSLDLISAVKEKIKEGMYKEAILLLTTSNTKESRIIQYFFAKYIYLSFSLIGLAAKNIEDIDTAMSYGFNWLPPSALVDLLGGKSNTIKLLAKFNLEPPVELLRYDEKITRKSQEALDYRPFLRSI